MHRKMRPFLSSLVDTNCFISLTLHAIETQSHGLRRFPELQHLYVVEFVLFSELPACGKNWPSPCTISGLRVAETRIAPRGHGRKEGSIK